MRLIEEDFPTENNELRSPHSNSTNDEDQGDRRSGWVHETLAIFKIFIFILLFDFVLRPDLMLAKILYFFKR